MQRIWENQGLAQKEIIKRYSVYKHIAPDGRVYIGITSQKPMARWMGGNGYKGNTYFTRAIKKYGWDNFQHIILAENLSEEDAKAMEIGLISHYKSNERKYGFNISSGGESKKGTKISEWQKQRISEASKGRLVSESTRKKLSNATSKTWENPEHRNHMMEMNLGENNPQYGVKRTDEEKIRRGAKIILQYDMDGNLISEYISIHDASEKSGISRDCISKCCRGIYKQASGYVWRYK